MLEDMCFGRKIKEKVEHGKGHQECLDRAEVQYK